MLAERRSGQEVTARRLNYGSAVKFGGFGNGRRFEKGARSRKKGDAERLLKLRGDSTIDASAGLARGTHAPAAADGVPS
jgi:hypothetical protein